VSQSVRVNASDSWAPDVRVVRKATTDASGPVVGIANADPYRLSVEVYADPANTDSVWIVPTANTSSGGRPLAPGASFTLNTTAAVFAYVKSNADQLVYVTTEGSVC
jgi:hypothetical protein